jgi:hypothetical protein
VARPNEQQFCGPPFTMDRHGAVPISALLGLRIEAASAFSQP